jgi:hypothetical protein
MGMFKGSRPQRPEGIPAYFLKNKKKVNGVKRVFEKKNFHVS